MKKVLDSTCLGLLLVAFSRVSAENLFEEIIVRVNNDLTTKTDFERTTDLLRRDYQKSLKGSELEKAVA